MKLSFKLSFGPVVSVLAALAMGGTAVADVKLPALFGSHMVLQQGRGDRIWGWADPGEEVTVVIAGQSKLAKARADGSWEVLLDSMPAGGPHTMTVKGKNTVTLEDVLVGEVWICSGQSNMQWDVQASNDADLESLAARFPRIRFISVPQVGTQEPQKDFDGKWEVCTPETVRNFSAVGYFFGRQLHKTLDVPVGLIDNAWGGSACEAWIRRDLLAADVKYKPLLDSWAEQEAVFGKKLEDWNAAVRKAKAEGKDGPPRPQDTKMSGNARPGNIYCGVLKPTIGYGLRGVIWYQGESNASRAYQYRDLFPLMIQAWREEWGIGNFSFYWVQLADFMAEKPEPSESAWAELREAQTMTLTRVPGTGEAVILDAGESQDIHPRNKQTVAKRLVRWAFARDYGVQIAHQSPAYKSMEKQGSKIIVTFDKVGGGLRAFDVPQPKGFAIAGADRAYVWAQAKIVAPDKVELWADGVADPVAVRYGWADNPVVNLYSREGLPATPFRTDDSPGVTAGKVK